MPQSENIFKSVQERYEIVEVAKELGIRLKKVGGSLRANSIANNGDGKDAFAVYPKSNSWYDFMLEIGGDITDLVAYVKYDGDKGAALKYLMPEWTSEHVRVQISEQQKFMEDIERWNKDIFDNGKISAVNALKYLYSRGLTEKTIKELKIGIIPSVRSYRIVFPYWDEANKKVLYYITRRYDWCGKGEDEKENKYMKASLESYPFLKNSILGLNTLKRGKDELIVTEGMMDWSVFYQEGYSVISPNGGDFGKLWPQVIEKMKEFKRVILAFDSDKAGQDFTYKTAKELVKNRIPFKVVTLDLTKDVAEFYEHGGKLDKLIDSAREGRRWFIEYIRPKMPLDDLTISEREKAMDRCKEFIKQIAPYTDSADIHDILIALRQYFPKEWISEVFKIARKGLTEEDVRDEVIKNHSLLYNEKTGFYEYTNKGIWEAKDDTYIQSYIQDILGRFVTGGKLTSMLKVLKGYREIVSDIPLNTFNTLPLVSFKNGTLCLDMKTGEGILMPHSEIDYTTVRLPYSYDPKAKCETWLDFIKNVTNGREDRQKVLQEFAGYTLTPDCSFQKALMLMGGGSNGKSVFTNIISAVLGGIGDGHGYISAAEPSKFSKDFRLMAFKHSWLNISNDAEYDLRGAEGVFKRIVAGETLEDSYKHKDPHPFKTRTKLMMCCNNFPTVNDTSDGFMRRWIIVNFPMHYVDKDKVREGTNERPLDPFLEEKLMNELPGIFNWLLAGLQRLLKQKKFTETAEQNTLLNDFRRANNPTFSFVEDVEENFYEENGMGKEINKHEIFMHYKKWAEENCEIASGAARFYSGLRSVLACLGIQFEETQRKIKFKDIHIEVEYLVDDDTEQQNEYLKDPEEEMEELNE